MRELGKQKRRTFYSQFLHQEVNVLVEDRRDKGTGRWKGFSPNYLPVMLIPKKSSAGDVDWINEEWTVKVTDVTESGLIGKVMERSRG